MRIEHIENPDRLGDEAGLRIRSLSAMVVERVILRMGWLEGRDRILVELAFNRGVPIAQLAGLMGVTPTAVRRRLRGLVKRLQSPEYLFCLKNRHRFSFLEREIIRRHFVQALPLKKTAARCGCSAYTVEQTVLKLRRLRQMWDRLAGAAPKTELQTPREEIHGTHRAKSL
jgi:DNA-directed RNA polymerase specialized sigma24 family protein